MMANTFLLMQIEVHETFILFTGNDFQSLEDSGLLVVM
jgi:hypothetical protein